MPAYFLSDVHLRLDHPGRGLRLARVVDRLGPDDSLTIVGDLCDFWYAARQIGGDPMRCAGLASLASFRSRGGSITILAGNHDAWLGPFYEETLGARFLPDALEVEAEGLRILAVHGHLLKAGTPWKKALNSRAFLAAFRRTPAPLAVFLGGLLNGTNRRNKDAFERRGVEAYRRFVAGLSDDHDLVILGHVHLPVDDRASRPRMVVLGGWLERSCHLVVDSGAATHVVEPLADSAS